MIRGVIYPGDAIRLGEKRTIYIWLGNQQLSKGNGPVQLDRAELGRLLDAPEAERVRFDQLTEHMQERSARATVDLTKYDGCTECEAWTGNPCRRANGQLIRRPHKSRGKRA